MRFFYYDRLSDDRKQFYAAIIEGLCMFKDQVKAPASIDRDSLMAAIEAVHFDHPEFFYVNFHRILYIKYSGYYVYQPIYFYDRDETERRMGQIRKCTDEIRKTIDSSPRQSVYTICGGIHRFLVRNNTYDHGAAEDPEPNMHAYTIEGPFLHGKAVCEGFALAFRYLCMLYRIDAIVVTGVSLRPGCKTYELHAWNIVRQDDKCAHVDATWDLCLTGEREKIRYDYYFLADRDMISDHQYVGFPHCNLRDMSYHERKGLRFKSLTELWNYLNKRIVDAGKIQAGTRIFLDLRIDFKMNSKELSDFTAETIRKRTRCGIQCSKSVNELQSVYIFDITIL